MNIRKFKTLAAATAPAMLLLSGCVDQGYDFEDIDTTTEVKINNLVLPLNLDAINLSDIIDIEDDSKIQVTEIDGKSFYAIKETGSISSSSIDIPSFYAPAPSVAPAYATFRLYNTRATSVDYIYNLSSFKPSIVDLKATNVDPSVKAINSIEIEPMTISVDLEATGFGSNVSMQFQTLSLQFLKGLTFRSLPSNYSYDAKTGILTMTNLACPNHKAHISLQAIAIDFTASGSKLVNGTLDFSSEIRPVAGAMKLTYTYSGSVQVPASEIEFTVTTSCADMVAKYITGQIEYALEGDGLDIAPVTLTDIPDFLNQSGTDLRLANPQIYLSLTNPLASDNLYYSTGMQLTAVRGADRTSYSLDNNGVVKVSPDAFAPHNFVLSPSNPATPLPEFAQGLQHVQFSGLSDILAGEGLPEEIEINLINPGLPSQNVTRFQLGKQIDGISGTYEFLAPLALKQGSVIIYTETEDGWYDEDLEKLVISTLEVEADVTSTLPLNAKLSGYPIDVNGNRIPGVTIEATEIPANANSQHIVIRTVGEIRNLDGITFEAVVTPGSDEALGPNQTIRLENLRARVSGSYTTDF